MEKHSRENDHDDISDEVASLVVKHACDGW